jgi:hypothetical protein
MIKLLSRQALKAICHPFCSPLLNPLRGPLQTRYLRNELPLPSAPLVFPTRANTPFHLEGWDVISGLWDCCRSSKLAKVWRSRAGRGAELDPCLARLRRGAESGIKKR